MLVRNRARSSRLITVVLAILVALALTYFSWRNALAAHRAALGTLFGYESAVRLEPENSTYWLLLGRYRQNDIEDSDVDEAIADYLKALSLDPQSAESWLQLGQAYELKGKMKEAKAAFMNAERVYPASAEVNWEVGNFLLRLGEIEAALDEIKRAVQADPTLAGEAFSRCLHANPNVQQLLNRLIPPSREAYVSVIREVVAAGDIHNALLIWNRLVGLREPIQMYEASSLFIALQGARRFGEATAVWREATRLAGLDTMLDPPGSILWDGGFESQYTGWGYAWTYATTPEGPRISFDTREKHGGRESLRITFDGRTNPNFMDVCHRAPVVPSQSYLFSAWVRTASISTDQGIRFVLWARDVAQKAVLVTSDVRGTHPWMQMQYPWTAPAVPAEVEICVLRNASNEPENRITGTTWIDDVTMIPIHGDSSKQ